MLVDLILSELGVLDGLGDDVVATLRSYIEVALDDSQHAHVREHRRIFAAHKFEMRLWERIKQIQRELEGE